MKKALALLVVALVSSLVCNVVLLVVLGGKTADHNTDKQTSSGGMTDQAKEKEANQNEKKSSESKGEPATDGPLYKGRPASSWIKQLQDKEPSFRLEAVNALGEIGPEAKSALPALVNLYQDPKQTARNDIFPVLCKLGHTFSQGDRFTNNVGMEFVWVPPGSFVMGSPKEEEDGFIKSTLGSVDMRFGGYYETQHKVTLTKGFFMGVCTVTQGQWEQVMGYNLSKFKGDGKLPVETVAWNECQSFCEKLSKKDTFRYRLPTEAEWEYACRAGTKNPFNFPKDKDRPWETSYASCSTDKFNYNGELVTKWDDKGRKKTTPVGMFPANAWGLHDMHGNVCQWCQDWFAPSDWNGDPKKGVLDPKGPEKPWERSASRVVRGGCWRYDAVHCRSAYRESFPPDRKSEDVGFRVCFSVE